MLVRFNVRNFLSFSERQNPITGQMVSHEFSLLPGKVRSNESHLFQNQTQNLLRFSAVYGANASGKSNFIKALDFFQKTVKAGRCPIGGTEKYCKTNIANKNKSSYFECEIFLQNQVYSYGFEIILAEGVVISEWLTRLSKNSSIHLFYKDGKEDEYHFADALKGNSALQVYQEGIAGNNVLFLTTMNKDKAGFYAKNPNANILREIYHWIVHSLEIVFPHTPTKEASFLINTTSMEKVVELLRAFGTGIVGIHEIAEEPEKIISRLPLEIQNVLQRQMDTMSHELAHLSMQGIQGSSWSALVRTRKDILGFKITPESGFKAYSLQFAHQNIDNGIHFRFSEEYDGTVRLFELIEILLSKENKTYVVDELDRCLHPSLTRKFIQQFFECTQGRAVQLIVTTHESYLMDFKLLRRDEIWFVDKKKEGDSLMYSLEEYNERFDKKIDKAYLEGRYGGVPLFSTLFPVEE